MSVWDPWKSWCASQCRMHLSRTRWSAVWAMNGLWVASMRGVSVWWTGTTCDHTSMGFGETIIHWETYVLNVSLWGPALDYAGLFSLGQGARQLAGWGPFHKVLTSPSLKSCAHSLCSNFHYNDPIRSQFCTCHDSYAVVTCTNSWHDLLYVRATCIFARFKLWAFCKMGDRPARRTRQTLGHVPHS